MIVGAMRPSLSALPAAAARRVNGTPPGFPPGALLRFALCCGEAPPPVRGVRRWRLLSNVAYEVGFLGSHPFPSTVSLTGPTLSSTASRSFQLRMRSAILAMSGATILSFS